MQNEFQTENARITVLDVVTDATIEADVIADLEQLSATEPAGAVLSGAGARTRGGEVAASGARSTIFDRLQHFGLLRKVTDIVMAKVAIPWHLRKDAEQEVHTHWFSLAAKEEYERDQLAYYAYLSGQHAALKLRRTIGAVVTIPGALFRSGRNTAFMEAIGAAVNPKDVDDYRDSLELSVEPVDVLHMSRVSESFFEERLGSLPLSAKQRNVAYKALVERKSAEDIAKELAMDLMYVERLLNQVTSKLNEKDASPASEAPVVRAPRKPRVVVSHKPAPVAARPAAPRKKAKEGSTPTRTRRRSRLKLSKAPSGGKAASLRTRLATGKRTTKVPHAINQQLSFGFEDAEQQFGAADAGSQS
ncbi:hypothetical protein AB4Y45_32120 [Paraburkholderia sp. EG287A]|uniref:hypothetical protein n=1 Tax=Paraburkholderia sp. EG287A TaxID=3237012 RepID=UPI0034D25C0E